MSSKITIEKDHLETLNKLIDGARYDLEQGGKYEWNEVMGYCDQQLADAQKILLELLK